MGQSRVRLCAGHLVDLAHGDVPLIHDPEEQRRAAAPAVRVAVRVGLEVVVEVERLELLDDLGRDAGGIVGCSREPDGDEVGRTSDPCRIRC